MTPRYTNARRLTEYLLGLEAMRLVVAHGVTDHSEGEVQETMRLLDQAIEEALPIGLDKERRQIRRRVQLLVRDQMVRPFEQGEELVSKFGLAVYYLLHNLMLQDRFVLEDGSPADRAMAAILEALSEYTTQEYARLDKSAFKAGRKMFERLQGEGYFREARWITEFQEVKDDEPA